MNVQELIESRVKLAMRNDPKLTRNQAHRRVMIERPELQNALIRSRNKRPRRGIAANT